ncbi:ABC transporter substrate-binding protein [Clostridiaceae bacterium HFYG-1003]|nr:ABC transporter substrate-binding protein [Clostridiaceae bacterium HFYG-1003]
MKRKLISGFLLSTLLVSCAPQAPAVTSAPGAGTGQTPASTSAPASPSTAGDLKKVTVLLDWTPNTNHTGLFVAKEKGYFAEAGLDVDIQTPPQGGSPQLVAAGKADFGIDFQDTLAPALAADSPLPVTAVAAILQHNTSGIISRKGEGLGRPKGMEGKKYATWDNPVEQAIIRNVVEKDGGDYSKVQLIPNNITDEVAALKTRQVDSVWIFYGWSGINAQVSGFDFDYFAFKDLNPVFDYYTPVLIASDRMIAQDPETVRKFVGAASKGYTFSAQNPQAAAEILLKHAPELDPTLTQESQKWMANQILDPGKPWGQMDAQRWDGFYRWLWENQLIQKEIPAGQGFTNAFIPGQ